MLTKRFVRKTTTGGGPEIEVEEPDPDFEDFKASEAEKLASRKGHIDLGEDVMAQLHADAKAAYERAMAGDDSGEEPEVPPEPEPEPE